AHLGSQHLCARHFGRDTCSGHVELDDRGIAAETDAVARAQLGVTVDATAVDVRAVRGAEVAHDPLAVLVEQDGVSAGDGAVALRVEAQLGLRVSSDAHDVARKFDDLAGPRAAHDADARRQFSCMWKALRPTESVAAGSWRPSPSRRAATTVM